MGSISFFLLGLVAGSAVLGSGANRAWLERYEEESRVQIRYGPFEAPSSDDDGGMKAFVVQNATKPCDECLVTFMQAGLEFPNGSYANANTSMWLHHMVLTNLARNDTTCPWSFQRFFASGNERMPIDFSLEG